MVSIDKLWEVVHGLFKEPIIGPLKSKMTDLPSWILAPKCKNAIFSKTKQFRAYGLCQQSIGSHTWAFQRTHYWTPKIQDSGDLPSLILTPKSKNPIF